MHITLSQDVNVAAPVGFETTRWTLKISCLGSNVHWEKFFPFRWIAQRWMKRKFGEKILKGGLMANSCTIIELKPFESGSGFDWQTIGHTASVKSEGREIQEISGLSRYLWLAKKQVQRRTNFGHIEWSGNKGMVIS